MIVIGYSKTMCVAGGLDLDLEWKDEKPNGKIGGGVGKDPYGNNYQEIHGSAIVAPNVEINANAKFTDFGNGYYIGGNIYF